MPFNRRPAIRECAYDVFHCCDLDFDLDEMTLIYECDLDILEMYLHTKKFLGQGCQKLEHEHDRRT